MPTEREDRSTTETAIMAMRRRWSIALVVWVYTLGFSCLPDILVGSSSEEQNQHPLQLDLEAEQNADEDQPQRLRRLKKHYSYNAYDRTETSYYKASSKKYKGNSKSSSEDEPAVSKPGRAGEQNTTMSPAMAPASMPSLSNGRNVTSGAPAMMPSMGTVDTSNMSPFAIYFYEKFNMKYDEGMKFKSKKSGKKSKKTSKSKKSKKSSKSKLSKKSGKKSKKGGDPDGIIDRDRAPTPVPCFSRESIELEGSQVVPPVTTTATGNADLTICGTEVCLMVVYTSDDALTNISINGGAFGATGEVRIDFSSMIGPSPLNICMQVSDTARLDAIKANPTVYYLQLSTAANPDGLLRGQLQIATPAPTGRPTASPRPSSAGGSTPTAQPSGQPST